MKNGKLSIAALVLLVAGLLIANGTAVLSDRMPMPVLIRWIIISIGVLLMIIALIVQKRSNVANKNDL